MKSWLKKIEHPYRTTLSELGTEEKYLNIVKNICEKSKDSMCNDKKLKNFSSKTKNKVRTPILPHLFNIVPEVPAKAVR